MQGKIIENARYKHQQHCRIIVSISGNCTQQRQVDATHTSKKIDLTKLNRIQVNKVKAILTIDFSRKRRVF